MILQDAFPLTDSGFGQADILLRAAGRAPGAFECKTFRADQKLRQMLRKAVLMGKLLHNIQVLGLVRQHKAHGKTEAVSQRKALLNRVDAVDFIALAVREGFAQQMPPVGGRVDQRVFRPGSQAPSSTAFRAA